MGLKRWLMRIRAVDYLLSIILLLFISGILTMSMHLSARTSHRLPSPAHGMVNVEGLQDAGSSGRRARRNVDDDPWEVPAEVYPTILRTPENCQQASILSEFPNATCFSHCTISSCGDDALADIENDNADLVCTARIIQLGFRRSGTGEISRWIKQHPDVTARYADVFINSDGEPVFDVCPIDQLRDVTLAGYFEPVPLSSVGSADDHKNYYLHCENCLTTSNVDYLFAKLNMDLPTAMFPFIDTPSQRFIITIKNPTDRALAEYFYPYIMAGTDLSTVGNQVLHDFMSAGIEQAKSCMSAHGPTGCVYGHNTLFSAPALDETRMLYDSCYSTHLAQVLTQVNISQTYFVKIEEYSADSYGIMQEVYNFVGLGYVEPPPTPAPTPTHKPIKTETIVMMDEFFEPFNRELRDLLGDDKWLYIR
ncbi:uncharacterized protein [Watersipora subatra]|uniref:uncharacterized protein n=1 Tax=Watersipora subatra TaxID=2589382 RepID=UPI00355BC587